MIKKAAKTILIVIIILILVIFYLSIIGVKTEKFNSEIKKNILKFDNKLNITLNEVTFLLNPYNFSINITTKNPQILLQDSKLDIKNIKSNISLKSLIKKKLLIDDLQISTSEIKLNDLILLIRTRQNTPQLQLLILNTIIKDGIITADINLNFDDNGKIKKDYKIEGFIKKTKLDVPNHLNVKDLNFSFNITKNKYSIRKVKATLNNIRVESSLIEIKEKKNLFLVSGKIRNKNKKLESEDIKLIFGNLANDLDLKKIEFSSTNNFSFSVNKKLRLNNLKVESIIDLNQLILTEKRINLDAYLPNIKKEIKFKDHKIKINYDKKKLTIKGKGEVFLSDKLDQLSYEIIKNNNNFLFNMQANIKNNLLTIEFLDYKKEEGIDSTFSINGSFKKNSHIDFKLLSLRIDENKILIKNLKLNKAFKVVDINSLNIYFKNNKNFLNEIDLRKKGPNYILEGDHFYGTKLINNIMNDDNESSSIFHKLNARIDIKIKKTYIDDINYLNNLVGHVNYKNNKINNLILESFFPNNKKINLIIDTNNEMETTTSLFTEYPKALIKRYDFIKGFEEGYLEFNSIKKDNKSKSILIIDNFKIKEVPVFAKLLSLASLQGIADILTGEGIRFTDFEMKFSNEKNHTEIEEMYAIGPSVSVLMDGYIDSKELVSLRGTLVPATTINRSIASIPLLGDLLIGKKTGEGVFGVSFKIKGPPKDLSTTVNPIKTLTPRFITRTLEKIKKN